MRERNFSTLKTALWGVGAIILVAIVFFNVSNLVTWATLNNPFQGQWTVVQLSNGEIVYGHLSGVGMGTLSLTDVYLLDTFAPVTSTVSQSSSSTNLVMGGAPSPQSTLAPVSYTDKLFINRSAVIYFKFVSPNDPALPYLR
jgi:hypothetical protein